MIKRYLNKLIFRLTHKSCHLATGVIISRKANIGQNCRIGKNSTISANVKLGDNVLIGENVSLRNIIVGNNSMIESGVKTVGPAEGTISVGKECYIGVNNILDTSNNISIGDFVHIAGPSTALWCHSTAEMCLNSIQLNSKSRSDYRPTSPITIHSNVYIGGNCTIYPGVTISDHSVIAPNSAVVKNVDSHTMVGGVPARIIKRLN